jgi:hypothetical protein
MLPHVGFQGAPEDRAEPELAVLLQPGQKVLQNLGWSLCVSSVDEEEGVKTMDAD